ncbi:hypothetical protein AVEN_194658-1 [Araneus ventricosus]|uniref:Uncharacterized protein n=1 Tax=Araneus ventricosus TaxID=182803 RepID=A0A4Y2A989_ARAVE|nr:hypothetical protein AVEN_194658-1 [Araneus ventricosus]
MQELTIHSHESSTRNDEPSTRTEESPAGNDEPSTRNDEFGKALTRFGFVSAAFSGPQHFSNAGDESPDLQSQDRVRQHPNTFRQYAEYLYRQDVYADDSCICRFPIRLLVTLTAMSPSSLRYDPPRAPSTLTRHSLPLTRHSLTHQSLPLTQHSLTQRSLPLTQHSLIQKSLMQQSLLFEQSLPEIHQYRPRLPIGKNFFSGIKKIYRLMKHRFRYDTAFSMILDPV